MKAIIFANGELALPENWEAQIEGANVLIAADGGARHMAALGLSPHILVGDLDSLDGAVEAGIETKEFKREKDQTDLELAILEAEKRGAQQVIVLGGLGRRWDHSLANLQLSAQERFADLRIVFLHGEERIFLIREAIELNEMIGMRLSLIPIGGDARGVRTEGLRYGLNGEDLPLGSSRGVSNMVGEMKQKIEIEEGLLMCVLSPGDMN